MRSVRLWDPTSLWRSRWTSGSTWNSVVINIEWVRLPLFQWPKVGLSAAKWLIKKAWTNRIFCFSFFFSIFCQQANIHSTIGCVSRPISSHDHNSNDQAITMDRYQSYFRNLDNLFSGKQQAAVKAGQNIYSLLIYNLIYHLIYDFFFAKDFQSSYITFDIFNNSTFFGTTEKANEK